MSSFAELGLDQELLQAIDDMGFEEPSPIQVLAVPPLLAGRDVLGQAQTGTGKTAAFGLPLLQKIAPGGGTRAIVLCPTRELAIQVAEELGKLAARRRDIHILPIYGGQPIERQFRALAQGAQVVVGTPGRVLDHLERGTLRLEQVEMAVLDEADEMLDMGFRDDIEAVLERTPAHCQRVMFSATMAPSIRELGKRFLNNPEMLTIQHKMLTVPAIAQTYYEVRPHQKMDALCRVLDSQGFRKALVFCSTKRAVDEVTVHLQGRGYQADGLHGNLAQPQRDRVMGRFRSGGIEILVATDVAARGIDVDDVDAVINYDIPHDVESYVHRIGRTGRAGRAGKAFTFVTVRENYKLRDIIRFTKADISQGRLPTLRDVDNIRTSRLLDEVRRTLEAGTLERWLGLVEEFLTANYPDGDISSMEMSAAVLKLLMQRDFGEQDAAAQEDWALEAPSSRRGPGEGRHDRFERSPHSGEGRRERYERGPRAGEGRDAFERPARERIPMTRLQLNVGHAQNVGPRELVGAIAGECGIPGRSIGAIDIQDNSCIVEVAADLADDVLTVLNGKVFIGGTRIKAASAGAGKEGRDGKDGFAPRRAGAPRRPYGAKHGKKPRGSTSGWRLYKEPGQGGEAVPSRKKKGSHSED